MQGSPSLRVAASVSLRSRSLMGLAMMVGMVRPFLSLIALLISVASCNGTGAKSGPRNLPCQCRVATLSLFPAVRLPSTSAMKAPGARHSARENALENLLAGRDAIGDGELFRMLRDW